MALKTWLIGLSLVFLCASQAVLQDEPTWTLTSAQPLSELVGEEYDIIEPALSPDGSAVGWWDGSADQVCAYFFEDAQTTCYETPDTLQSLGPYSYPTWSPDGRFLAFSESFFDRLVESDIWVLDVESGLIEDKTDDQVLGGVLELDGETPIDYLPTWNPADGTLYFFRSTRLEDGWSTMLYRMADDRPELVADLTQDLPVLSIFQRVAISPDGTRMALSVMAQQPDEERNGIYLIDLADGALTNVVDLAAIQTGLPEWATEGEVGRFMPDTLAWVGDEALIVSAVNRDFRSAPSEHTVYVDLADSTVTPLVDFTAVEERDDFFDTSSGLVESIIRVGVVAPTGDIYLGLRYGLGVEDATVAAIALPPDATTEAITVGEIPEFAIMPRTNRSTFVSQDGKALLYGWVLTFAQE